MSGEELKTWVHQALNDTVPRYAKNQSKFQPILIKLEHGQNFSAFIQELHAHQKDLKIITTDIKDLITKLGESSEFKQQVGIEFYRLWLQYQIIEFGSLKQRLDSKDLLDFPTTETNQLSFLKSLCIKQIPGYISNCQEKLLDILKDSPIYKSYIEFASKQKKIESPSRLEKISKVKEPLPESSKSTIFFLLLKKIVDKIGVIDKIEHPFEVVASLKDFFDTILESFTIESQLLTQDLKEVIFNTLHIQIQSNMSIISNKTQDCFKESFRNFSKFYECQSKMIQVAQKKISINDFLDYFEKILNRNLAAWYWPGLYGESLIIFLRDNCLDNKKNTGHLIELLNSYVPNLSFRIFNLKKREFLHEAFYEMPKLNEKGLFVRNLLKIAQKQKFDTDKSLPNGQNYIQFFQQLDIPVNHFQQLSVIDADVICFHIFDKKKKSKMFIYLTKEHLSELLDKIINPHDYEDGQLDSHLYHFEYTITRDKMEGHYKGTTLNTKCGSIEYDGPLIYGNVMEFGDKVKQFSWKIFKHTGQLMELNPRESDKIGQEIYKLNKQKDQNPIFRCKIGHLQTSLQINAATLQVKSLTALNSSQIKEKFGYLIFIPSYKGKPQEQTAVEQFQQLPNVQPQQNLTKKVNQTPYMLSDRGSDSECEQQQIINFEIVTFKFLGVFQKFFTITNSFTIDLNKNVCASDQIAANYFKRWEDFEIYQLMGKFLLQKASKEKFQKIPNGFKLMKKTYPYTQNQLKKFNLKIKKQMKKQMMHKYDVPSQTIVIQNMVPKKQANQYFQAFFQYCMKMSKQKDSKKNFILKVDEDQYKYIQKSKLPGITVMGKKNNKVQIQCNKKEKQKLEKELEALDQTTEFTYSNPEAFQTMKSMEPQYLKQIKLIEGEKTEQTFNVSYKLRFHPTFKQKFKYYCDMQRSKPTKVLQVQIKNDADYLHIYRSQMDKVDSSISVTKMGPNILLQYNNNLEKRVNATLQKIKELKQNQLFSIAKKSGKQYEIKGINQKFLYTLSDKLDQLLKPKGGNVIQALIKINYVKEDQYTITGLQISQDQQTLLEKLMETFYKSFKELKKYKFQIFNTEKYLNAAFSRLPKNQQYKKKIHTLNHELKTKLRSSLLQIIQKTTQNSFKLLSKEFQQYIINSKLDICFQSTLSQKNAKQLQQKTENICIFQKFLVQKIQQAQKESSVKNGALKSTIIKETEELVKELESRYKKSALRASNMKRYYKSVNILTTIYYGEQLPITKYLQQVRDLLIKNDVVMVKVGTGSGKSTVIPPYLVGLGYKKVVVTQPRRLPCRTIYQRISTLFGQGVAGYEVADLKQDVNNNLIYTTDGLLKMKAIFGESVFDKIDVLVIDQIHERSANIDILLLLLYDYFRKQKRKLKLILCSATIDKQIGKIMEDANLKVGLFEPQISSPFTVSEHTITEGTIIQKIVELSNNLKSDEQLLAFFPGVAEVLNTVKILKQKFNKIAHAITGNQVAKIQEECLKSGQIFISTSIAQTSLTFRKLRYVVDTRLSRWRIFDPDLELMKTEEDYSSNSSIKQRKGRVGRTCNGQYYSFVYQDYDFTRNREHNPTELQKIDFTNFIFELLLRENSHFKDVVSLLKKLNHNKEQFDRKIEYSKDILEGSAILKPNGTLYNSAQKLLSFGNIGNPQHNVALLGGAEAGCLINMAYLVAFQMRGIVVANQMLNYCKLQYKGGDLKVIHDFLLDTGNKINLIAIPEAQISHQLRSQCRSLTSKQWFNILVKIMVKAKQLLTANSNNIPAPSNCWDQIVHIFIESYKNRIFFNQSLFGGSKNLYQKIRNGAEFSYQEKKPGKNQQSKVKFVADFNSLIANKDNPPKAMLSLNCSISPLSECVLSICQEIKLQKISLPINIEIVGSQCQKKYFDNTQPIDQRTIFDSLHFDLQSNYNKMATKYNFPSLKVKGYFKDVVDAFKTLIEPKRRNQEIKIDLKKMLQDAIKTRQTKSQSNPMAPVITAQHSRILLQKLSFQDYKNMFSTMKFEMSNDYDVAIEWDCKESKFTIKNAKNIHLSKIIHKLANFFMWFSECQLISKEEYKIKPQYIGDCQNIKKQTRQKIMDRVNQIVDNRLEHYILKGWVSGRGPSTKYCRTARMIAVSWILVNVFHCVIKGGFVRDWVVNGEQVLPNTVAQRIKLLQLNPCNGFKQVLDDSVTPSDIDAELSQFHLFDVQIFQKEMRKLGISVYIEEDGWRKHIIFDEKSESGAFTADLIEPYTSMTHYTYDFDVNILYIKKGNLNSIGMKIPLEYKNQFEHKQHKVDLDQLLGLCLSKKMKPLKQFIPKYRFDKFKTRQWNIQKELIQPICYKSLFTQSFPEPPANIATISPTFHQKIVQQTGCKIVRIEHLKNKGWDDSFESAQHWIITQLQREAKAKDAANYPNQRINSNNKMLFHGTKSIEGANGIKQSGFDSRFYVTASYYGRGAYFADDPLKSHAYTGTGPLRYMFIVNVALGKQQQCKVAANSKAGPSKGHHSILGTAGSHREYVIDRWGQAKPLYLITYQ